MDEIITVWDADFIPYYVCHNKKGAEEKTLENCISLADQLINNINNSCKADYYCGFLTKGKCFRYKINPDYKGKRKYLNLPKYIDEVKDYIEKAHNFTFLEGYEADDLVMSFEAQNSQFKTILVSPDKDILGIGKVVYNPRLNTLKDNIPIEIDMHFWESMITGDTIDNIPGLKGKGKVYFKNNIVKKYINNHEYGFREHVLNAYIEQYGEYEGIKEFTKNYLCLKLVDNLDLSDVVRINKTKINSFSD